jgi:hypothetical protein
MVAAVFLAVVVITERARRRGMVPTIDVINCALAKGITQRRGWGLIIIACLRHHYYLGICNGVLDRLKGSLLVHGVERCESLNSVVVLI